MPTPESMGRVTPSSPPGKFEGTSFSAFGSPTLRVGLNFRWWRLRVLNDAVNAQADAQS